jgi:UDP-3-O-[3-hydroxymyristoyl] glucosamine N-acyltransferase
MKAFTLREIAGLTEGELRGDPERQIVGAAPLAEATQGEISFFGNPRYATQLRATRASAAFVPLDYAEGTTIDQIRVQAPAKAFEQMVRQFAPPPISFAPGVHPSAVIDQTAKVGRAVSIQPFVVIEAGVEIGDETVIGADNLIYPRVTLRERTRLGQRVILHSGVVLGADGFGFETIRGERQKVPQIGTVELGDDVELGANTCIDRGRFGKTRIGRGTKIDNLVQIAHNVVIGRHCIIVSQSGIAGSAELGDFVIMGAHSGIVEHVKVGSGALIAGMAHVKDDVEPGARMGGTPARPFKDWARELAAVKRLAKNGPSRDDS